MRFKAIKPEINSYENFGYAIITLQDTIDTVKTHR